MNRQITTINCLLGDTITPTYTIEGNVNYSFSVSGDNGSYAVTPIANGKTVSNNRFVLSGLEISSLPSGSVFISSKLVLRRYSNGFGDVCTYKITGPNKSYTVPSSYTRNGYVDWSTDASSIFTPGSTIPDGWTFSASYFEENGGYKGGTGFALLYLQVTYEAAETPCIAPAALKLTKDYCKSDQTVNLRWSGADEGRGHPIIGYDVQYSDDGSTWTAYATASTDETNGSIAVKPPESSGISRQYRVRTICGHEQYSSDWVVCPQTLTLLVVAGDSESPRLPWLLDRDLNRICRLYPLSGSLTLNLTPPSSASLTLADDVDISPRQFVEMYNNNGSAGVYQVSTIAHDFAQGTINVTLEHAIVTLGDALLMTEGTLTGTVSEVITSMLTYQTSVKSNGNAYWAMGETETPDTLEISVSYSSGNLMTALNSVIKQLSSDYYFDFEQINGVWKIHVLAYPPDWSQVRMSRNLLSISTSIDSSKLVTRLYPYGSGTGTDRVTIAQVNNGVQYIDATTKSQYGIIAATLTEQGISDPAQLKQIASQYLSNKCSPKVSLTVSALDLSASTGQSVDGFHIGWSCRVPLPKYGTAYNEHITSMTYNDLYGAPNEINLTLSNREQDVADSIATLLNAATIRGFEQTQTAYESYSFGASASASGSYSYSFKLSNCKRILSAYLTITSDVQSLSAECTTTGKTMTVVQGSNNIIDLILSGSTDSGERTHTIKFTNPSATSSWVCSGRINIRYIEGS